MANAIPEPGVATEQLTLRLEAIRRLAAGCNAFEFVAPDGGILPSAEPGAHIGIVLPNGIERQYSLLVTEEAPRRYVIGVKRDPASRGGSVYMFESLKVGDVIRADPPRNNFPLCPDRTPTVLIAGGIGITPIWCMIDQLKAQEREWRLHYATRTRSEAPFVAELAGDGRAHLHFDDEQGGVLAIADIVRDAPAGAHLYCCGPAPMLAAFEAATAGIPPERVHVEYFTQRYEAATDGGFVVALARTGGEVRVSPGQTILDAVRSLGVDVPSSCEEGICGACETRVLAGAPDHRDAILTERERAANKTMFICCSGAKSERLVLDL